MNKTVARLLGEDSVPPVDAPEVQPAATAINPSVQQLLAVWQAGNREAVALRVLDALDHYEDFLELAFQIGHEGALQLGRLMDDLTADQESPHRYDKVTDQDIPLKFGKQPKTVDVSGAAGDQE